MRTFLRSVTLVLGLSSAITLIAQTYTPKAIRIEGAGSDTAELLKIANLQPGTTLTKEQIEAALQRLGDTGQFADLSYTVNADALVFKLTASATSQSLPVRYANFVWWQPAELEQLVEARVPVFHGSLPLTGSLTDQVEAVLVDLLRQKGIEAKIETVQAGSLGGAPTSIALTITRPEIVVGELRLPNADPALAGDLQKMQHGLAGQDFDRDATARSIRENISDIYQNGGYLDVATEPPVLSPPRKDLLRYAIDATDIIHAGDLYRISRIDLQAAAPLTRADLDKVDDIKVGDPASVMGLRIARGSIAREYFEQGYHDAEAKVETTRDNAAHTIAYAFTLNLGELYHLDHIDASALPASAQVALAHDPKLAPGVVAGKDLMREIVTVLHPILGSTPLKTNMSSDRVHHTATIVLTAAKPKS